MAMESGQYDGSDDRSPYHAPATLDPRQSAKAKVEEIMEKYMQIKTLHPAFEHMSQKPEYFRLFSKVFNHHVRLIKSRPQDLEQGYVTVYDRALTRLTAGGRDTAHKGGIALFLEEILGIKSTARADELEVILKGNFALRCALMESSEAANDKDLFVEQDAPDPQSATTTRWSSKPNYSAPEQHGLPPKPMTIYRKRDSFTPDPRNRHIGRLLRTFTDAEREYHTTPKSDFSRKRQRAMFLRDSAENALVYLRSSKPEHYMIQKLKRTFEMAQGECIGMNGGRKRPFEMNSEEYARRVKKNVEFRANRGDCYRPGEERGEERRE